MVYDCNIKKRVQQYLDMKAIRIASFEREVGLSNGYWRKIKSISARCVEDILRTYPELSAEWLMTGKGEMLNDVTEGREKLATPARCEVAADGRAEGIPLIPFSAMAGALTSGLTVLECECEHYVVPAFRNADFLIQVKGTSMQPTYLSGDIVACQRVPLISIFFQWGKTYIIDTTQGALIKRIQPGHDDRHILIVSDNDKYAPFELPREEINAIALVLGLIRME